MNAGVTLECRDEAVCHVVFDRPKSSANIFDQNTLEALSRIVDEIDRAQYRGVVFVSRKSKIFIAGADVHQIAEMPSDELRGMIVLGQSVFSRIAALKAVTVAAIHGACLGGGYELCLACDYRIASTDKATRIGLPETQLGILPAWGGSTRLPRLIGLPKAAGVILEGKTFSAKRAKSLGMVDALAPMEQVEAVAKRYVDKGKPASHGHPFLNNALTAAIVRRRAAAQLRAKTYGHYPAPEAALDVLVRGSRGCIDDSLRNEEAAVLELADSEVCQNLMRVFFMQEAAKKKSIPDVSLNGYAAGPTQCAVIGAGVMGAGIAQLLSAKGFPVVLKDLDAEPLRKGMRTISGLYKKGVKRHVFDRVSARAGMDRVLPATTDAALSRADLVIEAAVERMDIKMAIFKALADHVGEHTILATNTSALSVSALAREVPHPERVIGLHFFNPVVRMPLVEIVQGELTSPEVLQAALTFVQRIGKFPVVVQDRPGFLVNRILMPYLVEAGRLFDMGVGIEDIDSAMLHFGMPMGPLRLIDEVGADVALHVARTLAEGLGGRLEIPRILEQLVEDGDLGAKTGSGFYRYEKGKQAVPRHDIQPEITSEGRSCVRVCSIADRLALTMVNEAAMCLEESVVKDVSDVDFAMIMGTGFAPFRGGPLQYADTVGVRTVVETLGRLAAEGGVRFAPCKRLIEMAKRGDQFYGESNVAI
jgi:3-hydroxyacyl-CoA dehydrogenase/enoyl-CoA hydratase/3-hydroxybutyryl-CoA epimerase